MRGTLISGKVIRKKTKYDAYNIRMSEQDSRQRYFEPPKTFKGKHGVTKKVCFISVILQEREVPGPPVAESS